MPLSTLFGSLLPPTNPTSLELSAIDVPFNARQIPYNEIAWSTLQHLEVWCRGHVLRPHPFKKRKPETGAFLCMGGNTLILVQPDETMLQSYILSCGKSLRYLSLHHTCLFSLNVAHLLNLETLEIHHDPALARISGLNQLHQLTCLQVSSCPGLVSLPGLSAATRLSKLSLYECTGFTTVRGFSQLKNLTELNLSGCSAITDLSGLDHLHQLKNLNLSRCSGITHLSGLDHLHQLKNLDLSWCSGLSALPEMEALTQLENLILSRTSITRLPDGIRHMKSLKRLDIRFLKLDELPVWLPEIATAFSMDIAPDPDPSGTLVCLFGTKITGVEISVFEQPYEMVIEWFRSRQAGTSRPLNEIKVVFLGDGEAGKSLTIARLRNKGGEPKGYVDVRTPGIVIDDVQYPVGDREATLHLWDFGGQEILHSMHRIFLTQRTIYVVVVDGRIGNQDERARYWLHNIQSFAKDAPVLLVLNKLDDGLQADVNATDLKNKYKGLKSIVKLSALKYTQEEFNKNFTDVLCEEIAKTGFLDVDWPAIWFNVKKELEKKGTAYVMDGKRYQQICRDNGVDQNRKELLHWFNDLGISFCCYDDYKLDNYVILKPDWITNALYIILFNERHGAKGGLVPHETIYRMLGPDAPNRDKIERVLPGVYYEGHYVQFVLDVIRKFGLSFNKDGNYEFIPMLADRNTKPVAWEYAQAADTLEFHMEFDYLPNNVLHRLMVDCRNDLDMDNVWLTGARFQQQGTGLSAVVVIERNVLKFLIRQKDQMHRPNTYLAILKACVDVIWRNMGLQEPQSKLIYKLNDAREVFEYQLLKDMLDAGQPSTFSRLAGRMVPIADIMNQSAPDNLLAETRLLDAIVRSCRNIQGEPAYQSKNDGSGMEDLRNRRIRDDLVIGEKYNVQDQSQRAQSGSYKSIGELDLLVLDENKQPWTIIEALRVRNGKKSDWNNHLQKLLDNYNYFGARFLYLLTYVDCEKNEFQKIWEGYENHIPVHNAEQFCYIPDSFRKLHKSTDAQYIKQAVCQYDCGGQTTTVYHIFVHIDPAKE